MRPHAGQRRERAVSAGVAVPGLGKSSESRRYDRHGGFGKSDAQRHPVRSGSVLYGAEKESVLHVYDQRT